MYDAKVLEVMISSPSDCPKEEDIIRDVLKNWNAARSDLDNLVLRPLSWSKNSSPEVGDTAQDIINRQVLANADILIATFWTRLGTPTAAARSGTVEEIERHVSDGKLAMVYFNKTVPALDDVENEQYKALKSFEKELQGKGLVGRYESMSDFKQKLFHHLSRQISDKYLTNAIPEAESIPPNNGTRDHGLGDDSCELLIEATSDKSGIIMRLAWLGGQGIQTNGKQFVSDPRDSREFAQWKTALDALVENNFVEPVGYKDEIFRVTHAGYQLADELRTAG